MKVLHISTEKTWRGGEQQMAYLIEGAMAEGVDCSVLCRSGSSFEKFCRDQTIRHVSVPLSGIRLLTAARTLKKLGEKVDLIHAHTGRAHSLAYIALLSGLKTPVVVSRRVDFKPGDSGFTRNKYRNPGIKKYVCVSNAIKRIMAEYLGDPSRCVTVYSGIDTNRFSSSIQVNLQERFDLPRRKRIIGNTSALAEHKDYFTFLRTAKLLLSQRSGLHFLIMGDGPMREELRNYAVELAIEKHVTFTGFLDDIPAILPQIDLFLMTSKTEGLGTSVLDAFAAGIPVVATRAGGIPEMVIDEKTGLLADVGDYKMLTDQVLTVLEDHELRKLLVANARKKLSGFTKEAMVSQTLRVYRDVLDPVSGKV